MHYLDNSATTPLCDEAKAAITAAMDRFGNPSSLHRLGMEALTQLDADRATVASKIGCEPKELYFTSCGSESNNTAIVGAVKAKHRDGNRIITSAIEHHSVMNMCRQLEKEGFDVVYIEPDKNGVVTAEKVAAALTDDTILVSIMHVNNETGAINPISEISAVLKNAHSNALLHTDCVQSFGKLNISPKVLGSDLISVSGHKVHAPKGIGALYIKKGRRILPFINGGGQERGMRSGTESTMLISAFAAAVGAIPDIGKEYKRVRALRDETVARLRVIDGVLINSTDDSLPYVINFSADGIRSEVMLHWLESNDIFVSSGSACAKGEVSHVLAAQGFDRRRIDSAIRVSFSHNTTIEDSDALVRAVEKGMSGLIRRK